MNSLLLPTVLVVDDDEDDRFFLELAFGHEPPRCRVWSAAGGTQALDLLTQASAIPDLIVLDVNMPGMNGFELLACLRQRPGYRRVPVVILTTSSNPTDQQQAQRLGAAAFVTKPSTYSEMEQVAKRLQVDWLTHNPSSEN